jgi:4-hydroxybenzoyl-CoA thioesterase/acyl-CoA thioester hydrolase
MKYQTSRRVEFRDTDTAGIVHFSNFFAYMEQAEHEFLRSIGQPLIGDLDGQRFSWPRVAANCNYRNAIRFEEIIDIELVVSKVGTKSITYDFLITRDETHIADGSITAVCCLINHGQKPESIEIPPAFVEAVSPYLAESDK